MKSILSLFLIATFFLGCFSFATEPDNSGSSESLSSFDSAFQTGLKNYQEKHFDLSVSAFQKALELSPKNISTLTNLALAQFQNGQKGWSIALLRKALNFDPEDPTARAAYDFILPQLEVKEIPHELLWSETLHARVLSPFSLFWFSCLAALFIFSAGWSILTYIGKLKRSQLKETVPPSFSSLTIFFLLGAVVFLLLLGLKIVDQSQTRGTIVTKDKASVLSSPDEKAPSLFEVYPGFEVIVEKSVEKTGSQWLQVNYPGGPTGWIPQSALLLTTEN